MTIGSDKANDSAPNLSRQEHEGAADAKRVTIVGHDGANYYLAGVNSSGELLVSGVGGSGGLATVTALQGTNPWIVDGTVTVIGGGSETVTCIQGTSPWVVDATFGVAVINGTVTVAAGGGVETVTCLQGTSPWITNATFGAVTASVSGSVITPADGTFTALTALDVTYNSGTTSATSAWVACGTKRKATLRFTLAKGNSPTDLTLSIEESLTNGTHSAKLMNDGLGSMVYSANTVGNGISRAYTFDVCGTHIRAVAVAVGTDNTHTFSMSNTQLYVRD